MSVETARLVFGWLRRDGVYKRLPVWRTYPRHVLPADCGRDGRVRAKVEDIPSRRALEQRSVVHGGAGAKKDQRPQSSQEAFCFLIVALDIHVHVRIRHAWVSAEIRPGSETLRVGIYRRASVVADE